MRAPSTAHGLAEIRRTNSSRGSRTCAGVWLRLSTTTGVQPSSRRRSHCSTAAHTLTRSCKHKKMCGLSAKWRARTATRAAAACTTASCARTAAARIARPTCGRTGRRSTSHLILALKPVGDRLLGARRHLDVVARLAHADRADVVVREVREGLQQPLCDQLLQPPPLGFGRLHPHPRLPFTLTPLRFFD